MSKKISVIIPVFNIESFINECLSSVFNQSLSDFEIIVVNDGSTDSSLKKVQEFRALNKRNDVEITIIDKVNGGLSDARNFGAAASKGRYLCFIDGDDFIERNMLQEMYNLAEKEKSKVVICDYYLYYKDAQLKYMFGSKDVKTKDSYSQQEILSMFFLGKLVISACNKLFLTSFYKENDFQFPKNMLFEDVPLTILISKAKHISFINKPLYYYRQRPGSIMRTLNTKVLKKVELLEGIEVYLKNEGCYDNLYNNFQRFYLDLVVFQIINDSIRNSANRDVILREIISKTLAHPMTIKYSKNYWANPSLTLAFKAALFILKISPAVYEALYRFRKLSSVAK